MKRNNSNYSELNHGERYSESFSKGVFDMKVQVDARGLECPKPVIKTKQALESIADGQVETIVDNAIAKENVTKFAKSMNCLYDVVELNEEYRITIFKGQVSGDQLVGDQILGDPKSSIQETVILVGKNTMGEGSDELGEVLIKGYFYTLTECKPFPKAILFLNSGVLLAVEGSLVLGHLRELEAQGVEVLCCGTCLDYYNLKDKLAVGGVTNMYTIVEKTNNAKNTIRI